MNAMETESGHSDGAGLIAFEVEHTDENDNGNGDQSKCSITHVVILPQQSP